MPPLLAAQFLFGDSDRLLVAVNLAVKALQRLPHLLHPLQQQLPHRQQHPPAQVKS